MTTEQQQPAYSHTWREQEFLSGSRDERRVVSQLGQKKDLAKKEGGGG